MSSDQNSENPEEPQEIANNHVESSLQKNENDLKEKPINKEIHNDFHVIETELNQHITEAGLFYQSLGDSLRRMESAHKKIYQQHKSASAQIQELKNKTSTAEATLSSYKHKYYSIVSLCFILIIVIVGQINYTMGRDSQPTSKTTIKENTNNQVADNKQESKPENKVKPQNNPNDSDGILIDPKKEPEEKPIAVPPTKETSNEIIAEKNIKKEESKKILKEKEIMAPTEATTPSVKVEKKPALIENIKKEERTLTITEETIRDKTKEVKKEPTKLKYKKEKIIEEKKIEEKEIQNQKELLKKNKEKIKKDKKEKKAKRKLIKKIWSEYHKALKKANISLAKEKLQQIIIIDPEHQMPKNLLKQLNEPTTPSETKESAK